MKVLIVSDYGMVSEAISFLLGDAGFETVAVIASNDEGRSGVDVNGVDVIIVTAPTFRTSVTETLKGWHHFSGGTPVIFISFYRSEPMPLPLLFKYSVKAVLSIDASVADLHAAVKNAGSGRNYITSAVAEQLASELVHHRDTGPNLTNREEEVLLLIAQGMSTTEIAIKLSLSPKTVSTHKTNIRKRLKLNGTSDIVRYALEKGLVAPRFKEALI